MGEYQDTHEVIPSRRACQAPDGRRAQGLRTEPPAAHLGNGQCILLCTYGLSLERRKSAWNVPKNNACSTGRNTVAVMGKTTALSSEVELSLAQEKVKPNF